MEQADVIIIGGGPTGIAVAAELIKLGIKRVLIIEKGSLTESIRKYPKRMVFFSTAENIEVGGIPFPTSNVKPTRTEALQYYRKVVSYYDPNLLLHTTVVDVTKTDGVFEVKTSKKGKFTCKFLIVATGYFDFPRKLGIPGENLPHVTHYYDEPFDYSFSKTVIVDAGNSAVSAALELYRHDMDVTVVHRGDDFKRTAKYWLIPDLKNRIKEGKIKTKFNRVIQEIKEGQIVVKNNLTSELETIQADFVLMLVGYLPDVSFLKKLNLKVEPNSLIPEFNPETYESNVANLYLCGTVMAGVKTESVFIENGRDHAKVIAQEIKSRLENQ